MGTIGVILIIGIVGFVIFGFTPPGRAMYARRDTNTAAAREAQRQIVCPHCQTQGSVTTKQTARKAGISGGKATGAVLTGGLSVVATGLSRKQAVTQMTCGNCRMSWDVV